MTLANLWWRCYSVRMPHGPNDIIQDIVKRRIENAVAPPSCMYFDVAIFPSYLLWQDCFDDTMIDWYLEGEFDKLKLLEEHEAAQGYNKKYKALYDLLVTGEHFFRILTTLNGFIISVHKLDNPDASWLKQGVGNTLVFNIGDRETMHPRMIFNTDGGGLYRLTDDGLVGQEKVINKGRSDVDSASQQDSSPLYELFSLVSPEDSFISLGMVCKWGMAGELTHEQTEPAAFFGNQLQAVWELVKAQKPTLTKQEWASLTKIMTDNSNETFAQEVKGFESHLKSMLRNRSIDVPSGATMGSMIQTVHPRAQNSTYAHNTCRIWWDILRPVRNMQFHDPEIHEGALFVKPSELSNIRQFLAREFPVLYPHLDAMYNTMKVTALQQSSSRERGESILAQLEDINNSILGGLEEMAQNSINENHPIDSYAWFHKHAINPIIAVVLLWYYQHKGELEI